MLVPDGIKADGKPWRVLICDDKGTDSSMVRQVLESQGYQVVKILENGGDLIDYCRENPSPVDLLLLDIVMPEIDGYAAFWELKELKYNTRVVFISVENTAGIIKNVLANGAYDFITKPLKRDTILERVKNVMKKPLV